MVISSQNKLKYLGQILGTIAILIFIPDNGVKTFILLLFWGFTFYPIRFYEVIVFVGACVLFSIMDIMAVKQGIFYFKNPDILGIPFWEFFMFGFYVLHGLRLLQGPIPRTNKIMAGLLAAAFALCFAGISDQVCLTIVTFGLLAFSLFLFHEAYDFIYLGYFIIMGMLIEYAGVGFGLWGYPGENVIGLPFWFITMWGCIGLLLRRLILPLLPH